MIATQSIITEKIYHNDVVLREVLKHIPSYKDRQSIELASLRLYRLSCEVPCRMKTSLRLTICYYNEKKRDRLIFLEKYNGSTYSKITNLTFRRQNKNSEEVLRLLGRRFWPEVTSLIVQECLNKELLTAINCYFPRVRDITCRGFTADGLSFLNHSGFARRIEKFGFIDFEMPDNDTMHIFRKFVSLNHITCWVQRKWPIDRFINELEFRPKVDVITIKHLATTGNEILNLANFSRCCLNLQFTDPVTFHETMTNSLASVPNLFHLNVTLLHLSQSEVISLFLRLSLFDLDSLWLTECVYNCDLVRIIRHSQRSPRLRALKLRCWEPRGDVILPLLSICPSSLKQLEVEDCSLSLADLQFLEKNCLELEEFVYKPTVSDGLLLDLPEDVSGAIKYDDLYRLFLNLPKLKAFHVNELIEPEFLLILCRSLTNIDKAKFLMRGIDRDRAYNVLSMFYERVTIRHSLHPFRSEHECLEDSETDSENDSRRSEIFRAYSNEYLKEWKNAVDEARGRTLQNYSWFFEEYLKPSLDTENSTTKWCLSLRSRRKTFPTELPNFRSVFCNQ